MSRKSSLFDIFTEEAQEIVVSLERDLLDLENNMGDKNLINNIFRSVHTLKGSSGMVDFSVLTSFAHDLENVLSRVRSEELKATAGLITMLLEVTDLIKKLVSTDPENAENEFGPEIGDLPKPLKNTKATLLKAQKTKKKEVRMKTPFSKNTFILF